MINSGGFGPPSDGHFDPSVEHLQFSAAREGLDAVPKPTSGKPLGLALKAEDVDQFRREKSSP